MTDHRMIAQELRDAADRIEARGDLIEQRFYDWQRLERIPTDESRGGGGAGAPPDAKAERVASRHLHEWRLLMSDAKAMMGRVTLLDRTAFPPGSKLEPSHMTTSQLEADGWCGSHWRIREFVAITTRPTGEPYYRGRCRSCGQWPGGDPPIEVLKAWRDGRPLRMAAS